MIYLNLFHFLYLSSVFIAFLAIENEGHREVCNNCFTERVVFNQQTPNEPGQRFRGLSQSSSRNVPQYRPIIAAYHPRYVFLIIMFIHKCSYYILLAFYL